MLHETERTRAIRRAQHDGYAPFTVRAAIRGDRFERAWNVTGRCVDVAFYVAVFAIGARLAFAGLVWVLGR